MLRGWVHRLSFAFRLGFRSLGGTTICLVVWPLPKKRGLLDYFVWRWSGRGRRGDRAERVDGRGLDDV